MPLHSQLGLLALLGSGALLGGALGLLFAFLGVQTLLALTPENLPRRDEVQVDIYVFGFALLLSLATGLLFGAAPAVHASKLTLTNLLKKAGKGALGGSGQRLRGFLVVSEGRLGADPSRRRGSPD